MWQILYAKQNLAFRLYFWGNSEIFANSTTCPTLESDFKWNYMEGKGDRPVLSTICPCQRQRDQGLSSYGGIISVIKISHQATDRLDEINGFPLRVMGLAPAPGNGGHRSATRSTYASRGPLGDQCIHCPACVARRERL